MRRNLKAQYVLLTDSYWLSSGIRGLNTQKKINSEINPEWCISVTVKLKVWLCSTPCFLRVMPPFLGVQRHNAIRKALFFRKSFARCVVMKLLDWSLQQGDRGNRKRYLPSDKERPTSPLSKRMAMSPDRGRTARLTHMGGVVCLFLNECYFSERQMQKPRGLTTAIYI